MRAKIRPDGQRDRHYKRAISKGDFSSLEQALVAAEQRQSTLQAELVRLDGNQPAALQLTPVALERHLRGMTEKLRSGVNGKVREAIQPSVARILVGADGSLTIEARPYGLLGVETDDLPTLGCRQNGATPEYSARVNAGRAWRVRYESPALGIV